MRMNEGKETWHRLLNWDRNSAAAERLAALILSGEGFKSVDPSHPLGGRDGKKDIIFYDADDNKWVAGVYFPRGQQSFSDIKSKFIDDFSGVKENNAYGFSFITNQELRLSERQELIDIDSSIQVDIYHLERIATILNAPKNYGIRLDFLDIEMSKEEQLAFFANVDTLSVNVKTPALHIKGIDNDNPTPELHAYKRNWLNVASFIGREKTIKELFDRIKNITVPQKDNLLKTIEKHVAISEFFKVTDAVIDEKVKKIIIDYSNKKSLVISSEFFHVGNLQMRTSNFTTPFANSNSTLQGTDEEQEKFKCIISLYHEILKYNDHFEYFSDLESKYFVKCILSNGNTGTTFDEDIDIKLLIPKGHICYPNLLPIPGYSLMKWCNEDSIVEDIFEIRPLVDVFGYSNYPAIRINPHHISYLSIGLFQGKSTKDEYKDEKEKYLSSLEQIFCYDYHKTNNFDIWSFNVPYIKQNTSMCFPSILVFNSLPDALEFEIRSRYLSNIVSLRIPIIKVNEMKCYQ